MNNLLQRYEVRRHSSNISLLSILAEEDLPNLIRIELRQVGNLDIKGERYSSPLLATLAAGNENTLRTLLTLNPHVGACELGTSHDECCPSDHAALTKVLLASKKVDMNIRDKNAQTPLSRAAGNGHTEVVKLTTTSPRWY
jgi:ankyrin repeat protein